MFALRKLETGLAAAYEMERVRADHRMQSFVWRVHVTVPVYEVGFALRIELDEGRAVRIYAEGWAGHLKHTYGGNRLCMWYPQDPIDRRWEREEGLLKLADTAVAHLFKELYYRETGEWLGEEAPHAGPKVEARADNRAAA